MPKSAHNSFDFEAWSKLANSDPDGFEARRNRAIEEVICHATPRTQMRLRRLQWKLDQVRATSATPMAACIRMNRLMWDRITGPGGLLETLTDGGTSLHQRPVASVLDFQSARRPARKALY